MYYLKFQNGNFQSMHQMEQIQTLLGAKKYIKKLAEINAQHKSIDDLVYILESRKKEKFFKIIE